MVSKYAIHPGKHFRGIKNPRVKSLYPNLTLSSSAAAGINTCLTIRPHHKTPMAFLSVLISPRTWEGRPPAYLYSWVTVSSDGAGLKLNFIKFSESLKNRPFPLQGPSRKVSPYPHTFGGVCWLSKLVSVDQSTIGWWEPVWEANATPVRWRNSHTEAPYCNAA